MSLRDDLDHCFPVHIEIGNQERLNRLRAVLTPAAEAWLAALPGLMEMESAATPGPWQAGRDGTVACAVYGNGGTIFNGRSWTPDEDAHLTVVLRNALKSAVMAGKEK